MTPYEFYVWCKGRQEQEHRQAKNAIAVAFQGECFAREKSLSGNTLKRVLDGLEKDQAKPKAKASTDEFAWAAIQGAFVGKGGTITVHQGPIWGNTLDF